MAQTYWLIGNAKPLLAFAASYPVLNKQQASTEQQLGPARGHEAILCAHMRRQFLERVQLIPRSQAAEAEHGEAHSVSKPSPNRP